MNLKQIQLIIKTMPVSENSLDNTSTCREFIRKNLASIDELEGGELIRTCLKEHFRLHSESVKLLVKFHKEVHSEYLKAQEQNQPKGNYQEEILKELQEAPQYVEINPAQDFVERRMMFTFYGGDTPYLVTSSRKIIKFDDLEQYRIKVRNNNLPMSKLNPQIAVDYVKGKEVDMRECLDKIVAHIKQYVILQDVKLYTYLALWIIGTYMYRTFRYYPYLWINADKGSGKSRVMEVICPLAFNGQMSTNQTQATVFRSVDADGSTLFIDEFEKMGDEMQTGILTVLNGGFNVDSGNTSRMESQANGGYKKKTFNSYSPKVFAGISEISDVLQDRCVKIRMLKKSKDEHVARYKVDDALKGFLDNLRADLYVCALNHAAEIKTLYDSNAVDFPNQLSDRECDIWECIFILSKFIDDKYRTTLQIEMKELAVQGSSERTRDNVIKNVSYKLLNSLVEVTDTIQPVKQVDGIGYYNTDAVYNFLKEQEDYDFLSSKRALTTELKTRFEIRSSRTTINCEKVPVYGISQQHLEDLLERYNIIPKRETSCPAV